MRVSDVSNVRGKYLRKMTSWGTLYIIFAEHNRRNAVAGGPGAGRIGRVEIDLRADNRRLASVHHAFQCRPEAGVKLGSELLGPIGRKRTD
jgi:hypothetical protein